MSSHDAYVQGGRALGSVPRASQTHGAAAISRAERQRLGPSTAFWGMVMFVMSEGTLILSMIGAFFYLRFQTNPWPPDGLPKPAVVVPMVLAGVLLTTSLPMQLASNAARAGKLRPARWFIALALFVQCGFIAYEMHDFGEQLHQFGPTVDAYASIHYVLLGTDHAHIWVGIAFNLWLLGKLSRGLTTYRVTALHAITWYWHAVNLLTLVVFGTLVSAAV